MAAASFDNKDFDLLTKAEYFHDLVERISHTKKGDRVLLATMNFDLIDQEVRDITAALRSAAERGVETSLIIDARSFPLIRKLPINRKSAVVTRDIVEALDKLLASGGSYAVTNETYRRFINPFAGRSHIKVAIINDVVYVGGCNLHETSQIDMMVRWRDSRTADWLYGLMRGVLPSQNTRVAFGGHDREFSVDARTKLLLDSGMPKQSVIFEHALKLIDEAQEWLVMTCQFFPNSITAEHLARAYRRGVDVSIYFNRPGHPGVRHKILQHTSQTRERMRLPQALFAGELRKGLPYLHAKLLATEQGVMIGSHNYIAAGVNFGTAELALQRMDNAFARQAVDYFTLQLGAYP